MVIARTSLLKDMVKQIFMKYVRDVKTKENTPEAFTALAIVERLQKEVCDAIEDHESFGGILKH